MRTKAGRENTKVWTHNHFLKHEERTTIFKRTEVGTLRLERSGNSKAFSGALRQFLYLYTALPAQDQK